MDLRPALALALVAATAASATPQTVSERRVREAIEDAARGVGQVLGAGSPLTGPAAPTGGLGRLRLGLALGLNDVEVEDPRTASGRLDFQLPVGSVNTALGLSGGSAGAGAVDLLGRLGVVAAGDDYEAVALSLGLGLRVGLLPGRGALPDVSASVYRTWVDGLEYGDLDGDEIAFSGDVVTWSTRIDASKRIALVTPYAGVGLDRTGIDARYHIPTDRSTSTEEIDGALDAGSTHGKAYVGVEAELLLLVAAVEVGQQDGGSFLLFGLRLGR